MKVKIKKYIKEVFIFIVLLAVAMNAMSYYRSLDLNKDKFEIKSFKLINNTEYKIDSNKPLLIHFWATWCPVCKVEAPNIESISKDYEVLTIAVQSGSKEEIEEYLEKENLSFKVVNDEDGTYARMFNINVFPTTIIYDKDKNTKFTEVGYTTTLGLYSRMELVK